MTIGMWILVGILGASFATNIILACCYWRICSENIEAVLYFRKKLLADFEGKVADLSSQLEDFFDDKCSPEELKAIQDIVRVTQDKTRELNNQEEDFSEYFRLMTRLMNKYFETVKKVLLFSSLDSLNNDQKVSRDNLGRLLSLLDDECSFIFGSIAMLSFDSNCKNLVESYFNIHNIFVDWDQFMLDVAGEIENYPRPFSEDDTSELTG